MKRRRALLFTLTVVLALCISCGVWLYQEQRQYALNRQLIAALVHNDTRKALALVNAGADPNTLYKPPGVSSLLQILKEWPPRPTRPEYGNPTAFLMVCGARWEIKGCGYAGIISPQFQYREVTAAMLYHGANAKSKEYTGGWTALHYAVSSTSNCLNKQSLIKLLLDYGADPDALDNRGKSAISNAEWSEQCDLVALLRQYSKHP